MKILYPKNYIKPNESTKPLIDKEAIKASIKNLVKDNPMSYEDIIKTIQKDIFITNDDVHNLIVEIDAEYHPPVIEKEIKDNDIK